MNLGMDEPVTSRQVAANNTNFTILNPETTWRFQLLKMMTKGRYSPNISERYNSTCLVCYFDFNVGSQLQNMQGKPCDHMVMLPPILSSLCVMELLNGFIISQSIFAQPFISVSGNILFIHLQDKVR